MANQIDVKNGFVSKEKMLFEHNGAVTKADLLNILPKMEEIMESQSGKKLTKRKVINIAIESLQNIQIHSSNFVKENNYMPFFGLIKANGHFEVVMGNLVGNSERVYLEDKIVKLNSLDEDEVKYLYNIIMRQTFAKFTEKGGAGLGLIDMKKKSGQPLVYDFLPVDEKLSYFRLKVVIPNVAQKIEA